MAADLTIVIPAFNEAERLADGFARLEPVLLTFGESRVEVIVIDDGSRDDTLLKAHEVYGHLEHARFVQHPTNLGKGAALRLGMGLASGTFVITADADMSIDPVQFPLFVAALGEAAFVPGSRAQNGRIRYDSRLRTLAGEAFGALVRHVAGSPIRDTQCGCKGYQVGPARLLALIAMIDRFAFDVELFYLAKRLGLTVRPLAVTWRHVAGSSIRPGRDAISVLRDVRAIPHTRYENPTVELESSVDLNQIGPAVAQARLHGLVLARGPENALLVLGRDGALGGATVASALKGSLRTTGLAELRGRSFEAV